ncbi:MAG: 4a-hydroxytetrahydrobiopterin dehydratase [Anaerolineae bacterium]|jgi:4a-hydroxytetrahydrobiopterin dehydratase
MADTAALTAAQIGQHLSELPEWQVVQREGVQRLERTFKFRNFARPLAFTNQVGELAERENHHPAILLRWGAATVSWWTHSAGGITENDFAMAARCDSLFAEMK